MMSYLSQIFLIWLLWATGLLTFLIQDPHESPSYRDGKSGSFQKAPQCLWRHCPMTSWSTATPNLWLSPVWDLLTQQRERSCGDRFSPAVHLSCGRGRLCMERLPGSVKVENVDIHFWAWYLDISCNWGGRNRKFSHQFYCPYGTSHPSCLK